MYPLESQRAEEVGEDGNIFVTSLLFKWKMGAMGEGLCPPPWKLRTHLKTTKFSKELSSICLSDVCTQKPGGWARSSRNLWGTCSNRRCCFAQLWAMKHEPQYSTESMWSLLGKRNKGRGRCWPARNRVGKGRREDERDKGIGGQGANRWEMLT